jgi:hypothetical protein
MHSSDGNQCGTFGGVLVSGSLDPDPDSLEMLDPDSLEMLVPDPDSLEMLDPDPQL